MHQLALPNGRNPAFNIVFPCRAAHLVLPFSMPAKPKPLDRRLARAVLRTLYRNHSLELREEGDIKSLFLDSETEARHFGRSWEDVVEQAGKSFTQNEND